MEILAGGVNQSDEVFLVCILGLGVYCLYPETFEQSLAEIFEQVLVDKSTSGELLMSPSRKLEQFN